MRQEEVEGPHRLLDHHGYPFHILQGDIDLLGAVADVRGPPGGQERHHHDSGHQDDDADEGKGLGLGVGQARRSDQVTEEDRRPQPGADGPDRQQQPGQPAPARVLAGGTHVGHVGAQHLFLPELVDVHGIHTPLVGHPWCHARRAIGEFSQVKRPILAPNRRTYCEEVAQKLGAALITQSRLLGWLRRIKGAQSSCLHSLHRSLGGALHRQGGAACQVARAVC